MPAGTTSAADRMLPLAELDLGFSDAANYYTRKNKEPFNKFFVRSPALDQLLDSNRYFLIGEKGTGKTAFAVFLSNNDYKENRSSLTTIAETDYQAFVQLKRNKQLLLSDYDSVWRMILMLLLAKSITAEEIDTHIIGRVTRLNSLQNAIDDYYNGAFAPEVVTALKFVENSTRAARIIAKFARVDLGEKTQQTFENKRFQTNIQYIRLQLKEALSRVKLKSNRVLFIDGIDIRPAGIQYPEYLECVRGLANAAWYLNHTEFANFKDSPGRLRIVLLLRPDIFAALNLQNQNAKIQDNAVFLEWITTYPRYRTSQIFEVADRLLSVQQSAVQPLGAAWDHYYPFTNDKGEDRLCHFFAFRFSGPATLIR